MIWTKENLNLEDLVFYTKAVPRRYYTFNIEYKHKYEFINRIAWPEDSIITNLNNMDWIPKNSYFYSTWWRLKIMFI